MWNEEPAHFVSSQKVNRFYTFSLGIHKKALNVLQNSCNVLLLTWYRWYVCSLKEHTHVLVSYNTT